jgi:hypothetical protein
LHGLLFDPKDEISTFLQNAFFGGKLFNATVSIAALQRQWRDD